MNKNVFFNTAEKLKQSSELQVFNDLCDFSELPLHKLIFV
jgi:hypothetical protein